MGSVFPRDSRLRQARVGCSATARRKQRHGIDARSLQLCQQLDLHFVGNVEGHGLSTTPRTWWCDGFVATFVLKNLCESLAKGIISTLKEELGRIRGRMIGAYLAKDALRSSSTHGSEGYGARPCWTQRHGDEAHGSAGARAS